MTALVGKRIIKMETTSTLFENEVLRRESQASSSCENLALVFEEAGNRIWSGRGSHSGRTRFKSKDTNKISDVTSWGILSEIAHSSRIGQVLLQRSRW